MFNNNQGIVPSEGQDQSQESETQRQINRQLSQINFKLEADSLASSFESVATSFEFHLKDVLQNTNYTKHQLADKIESLLRQDRPPPLDLLSTSILIVTFDGDDKLDTIYKRSSIRPPPDEQLCGFGYHTKTCSLFKLKSLDNNNNSNVSSNKFCNPTDYFLKFQPQSLNNPPNTLNQQEDPLQSVFNLLCQHQTHTFTCIEMNDVDVLVKLKTKFPERSVDALVKQYFEFNSRFFDPIPQSSTQFELKKPRGNDVIEFIQNQDGFEPDIFGLYKIHLENRKEYCCFVNQICQLISTRDVWTQIISRFPQTIKDLIDKKNFFPIAEQTALYCDFFCSHHKSFMVDSHLKRIDAFIREIEELNGEPELIASMTQSFCTAFKRLVDVGFNLPPDLKKTANERQQQIQQEQLHQQQSTQQEQSQSDVKSSVDESLETIESYAKLLPLSIAEAYCDFQALRGLPKIIINKVESQTTAETRPNTASPGTEPACHIWNCYPSSPYSDLYHIVPWRKGHNHRYYRPADAPTHCVVAAIGWSQWSGLDNEVNNGFDNEVNNGILCSQEFNKFQNDIWRAVATLLPLLSGVCDKILMHGTTYDYDNVILAGGIYVTSKVVKGWMGTGDTNQKLYDNLCVNAKDMSGKPSKEQYKTQYKTMINSAVVTSPQHLFKFLSLSPGRPGFTQRAKGIKINGTQNRCHEISDLCLFNQIIKQFDSSENSEQLHTKLSKLPNDIFGEKVHQKDLIDFKGAAEMVKNACDNIFSNDNYYSLLPELDAVVTRLNRSISSFLNNLRPGDALSNQSIQEAIDPKIETVETNGTQVSVLSFAAAHFFEKTLNLLNENENTNWASIEKEKSEHFDIVEDSISDHEINHEINRDYIYVKTSDTTKYTTLIGDKGNRCYVCRIKRQKNDQGFFEVEG